MKGLMEKHTIITLKVQGKSNRAVAKVTGMHRKTVAKYWNDYQKEANAIESGKDTKEAQEKMTSAPKYDASARKPRKYTAAIDAAVEAILEKEKEKRRELGEAHKQALTNAQIHGMLREQGHDIGMTAVSMRLREKRQRNKEAFIRQEYEYGDRLEYDFGEVRLIIGGKAGKYHMAALSSPAGKFRWAYLYDNEKKAAFMDSHVRFFEMVEGVYREVVYDNMRNVVIKFIGRNEKELNPDLVKMSMYYGFSINVTNCYSGNEKGYVESSVKKIRREAFAKKYRFETLSDAEAHLERTLRELNEGSMAEAEKRCLMPYRPKLELAKITEQKADKYSFIRVENNYYSVPEYLVGKKLTVKVYMSELIVFAGMERVCQHAKAAGVDGMVVNVMHYLDTLRKKPGALKNSKALKSHAALKSAYDRHFMGRAREFIDLLRAHQDKPLDVVAGICEAAGRRPAAAVGVPGIADNVERNTARQIQEVSALFMKEARHGN